MSKEALNKAVQLAVENDAEAYIQLAAEQQIFIVPKPMLVIPERIAGLLGDIIQVRIPGHAEELYTATEALHGNISAYDLKRSGADSGETPKPGKHRHKKGPGN